MDVQLKKGLLDLCVLRALVKNDSYGYQIIKDVSVYIEIPESTLYPILKRLESNNLVESYSVEYNSRLRKYYKITKLGLNRIDEFIVDWEKVTLVYKFIKGEVNND